MEGHTTSHRPTKKVLDVLEILSQSEVGLSLTEIARRASIPKGSLFPILHTMADRGYIAFDEDKGCYSIGIKTYLAGRSFSKRDAHMAILTSQMKQMVIQCQETCQLGIRDGARALYIAKEESPQPVRLKSDVGRTLPLYCTAIGKALMCDMKASDVEELLGDALPAVTENTVTTLSELQVQLAEVHKRRIAFDRGEITPAVSCVATAIRQAGKLTYAISISVPSYRFDNEKQQEIIELLDASRIKLEKSLS